MKHNHLKDITGIRIRHQYFNCPIYMSLCILLIVSLMTMFVPLFENDFHFSKWMDDIFEAVFAITIFIVPCTILSVLNRFFFGKIVCVLNGEGIHYKDGLIKWNDILSIEYNITEFGRTRFRSAYIDVVCKNKTIQIKSVPLYMFSLVKKYNADIETKKDKMVWVVIAASIIISIIISAVGLSGNR